MTRRALCLLPFAGCLRAQPKPDISVLANNLADSYNTWAKRANEDGQSRLGMLDAKLILLWREEVRPRFRALDKLIKA